jgi:hypothetical protein
MSTTSTPTPATTPSLPPITWLRLPAALLTRHTLASPPLRISLFSTTTMLRIGSLPGSGRKIKGSSRPEVRLVRRYPFLLRELARRGGRGGKCFPLQLLCSSFTLACLIWRFHRPLSPASVTRSFRVRPPFSDGRTQLYRGLKLTVPFPSISIQLSRSSIRCWEILRCMLQAFPLPPFDCTSLLGTSVTNPSLSAKLL